MFFLNVFIKAKRSMLNLRTNKILRDVQWSFLSIAASALAHLLLRVILGKTLGPAGLGLYTLLFTIYLFGMQFAAFGYGAALTKYIAEYEDNTSKIKEYVSSGLIGSIISGLTMGVILYLFSTFISIDFFHIPEMVTPLRITALCFPFIAIQKAVTGTLNGLRKMNYFAMINILQNISVLLISTFCVLTMKMGVIGAVFGFVVPTILIGTVSLLNIRKLFSLPSIIVLWDILKEISLFGFYIVLGNSIGMINTQIDSLLIGRFMSETDVGYYATAIIITQSMTLIPAAVQAVTNPAISIYYGKKEYSKIKQLIRNTTLKVFAIEFILLVLLIAFGKYIIVILFSEEFTPSYVPMLILSIGYLIYSAWTSVGTLFSSIGKANISFKLNGVCALLNTILNLLLIPKLGILGAASATTFSLILTCMINFYFTKKYISVPTFRHISKV